jgi:uncharacterized protein (TIGR02265 family)
MSDIRGLIIQSRLEYIESLAESNTYGQVMQKLSEPARQAIGEQVFLTNLYPFYLLKDLDSAIGESLNIPLESIFRNIGEKHADVITDRYFYNYVESKAPHKYFKQLGTLYHNLWHFGKYAYKKINQKSVEIKFDYDEDIHKPYCWFINSFLEKGLVICGGKSIEISELQCEAEDGESCIYLLKWK